MTKNILKFLGKALVIVLVGAGIIQGVQYLRYRESTDYQIKKEVENLRKQVAEDPYGGDTPEETLQLFIDALKRGDTDLAAKYFVLEEQDKWREDLARIKEKNLLDGMIKDFSTAQRGKDLNSNYAIFSVVNEENEIIATVSVTKQFGSKWRIQDL